VTTKYDFRRTEAFNRDAVRSLQAAHELFTRRVASAWGSSLRALVQLDPIGVDQVPYDAYIRSMPNPNVLAVLGVPPLPGSVVCELNPQLAVALVDRLLGGRATLGGEPVEPRRPTDLETALLSDLIGQLAAALTETLAAVPGCKAVVEGVEYNPQLVQVVPPSDTVLVLSYRLGVSQGINAEGLLTVCYPASTVMPLVDRLQQQRTGTSGSAARPDRGEVVARQLAGVALPVTITFNPSRVAAADLASLAEGDVLRLDQRVGDPVLATVAGHAVLEGHLGRRGRRLAFQVARWVTAPGERSPYDVGRSEE
jgi:flagellar motor switch protein FliM